jgi:hypothetical protein
MYSARVSHEPSEIARLYAVAILVDVDSFFARVHAMELVRWPAIGDSYVVPIFCIRHNLKQAIMLSQTP